LLGLVKAFWTLDAAAPGTRWIEHQATPDGCIELIARVSGRSRWNGEQPERFVVGLSQSPIAFEISGDARFAAIRLWPWTWRIIGGENPDRILGRWVFIDDDQIDELVNFAEEPRAASELILAKLPGRASELKRLGCEILNSRSVDEMRLRTGMTPRQLQRWFAEHVGLPPRSYLRLLRFQQAFEELPNAEVLAHHAMDHGFADQAHMAREFRRLAGEAASRAKAKTRGPFLR
jgi:AraC-like DNA-binding protein